MAPSLLVLALMFFASPLAAQAPVAAGPPRPAPLFEADWGTAIGNSQRALRDLGRTVPFDQCEGQITGIGNDVLYVVPALGLGFPAKMVNVLRVKRSNVDSWAFCRIGLTPHWPVLGVGQAYYWRVYLRVDIPNAEGKKTGSAFHPIQQPQNTNAHFEPINFHSSDDGTMALEVFIGANNNPWPFNQWGLGKFKATGPDEGFYSNQHLPKFTVLRVEWMYRRDTDRGYSAAYRVYDDHNVLLWSEDGAGAKFGAVMTVNNGAQTTLKAYNGKLQLADPADVQSLSIGVNGGPYDYRNDVYFYMGGLKLCADTWCGPY